MRQTAHIISTYSADTFGVCSALFELGGMVIMHDASGCNSTYTTHDEPRWYDMDSLLFITGLSEIEAVMGDDEKTVSDIVTAARDLHPRFIAICGTPVPAMIGTDFAAVARVIEARTGIPALGIPTTGMNPYTYGISKALEAYAERFVKPAARIAGTANFGVKVAQRMTMAAALLGCAPEELARAAAAEINFVVSASCIGLAEQLKARFGTPYAVGLPMGGRWIDLTEDFAGRTLGQPAPERCDAPVRVFGEAVYAAALAADITAQTGIPAAGIDSTELWEDDVMRLMRGARAVVGLAHEACSGRIYRDGIPDLMTHNTILHEVKK